MFSLLFCETGLHLLAWFGLKSDNRIIALLREESGHELLQDRYATLIAARSQLDRQRSGIGGRCRSAHPISSSLGPFQIVIS